jgi:protein-S-isoprenylcysteine O-methyltransferase Ste14
MTVPQLAVLLAASACFASYFWGLLRFFRHPGGSRRDIGLIKVATALAVVAHLAAILLAFDLAWWRFTAAIALYTVSLALFWWAIAVNLERPLSIAFSDDRPAHLMTTGPYALTRNPLYVSYMLCWIAGVLATGQWWLAITVLALGWIYHRAALAEEAKFTASPLAGAYAVYAARTGRYLPRLSGRAR